MAYLAIHVRQQRRRCRRPQRVVDATANTARRGSSGGDPTIQRLADDHSASPTWVRSTVAAITTGSSTKPTDWSYRSPGTVAGNLHSLGKLNAASDDGWAVVTDLTQKPYDVSQAGFPYGAVREVLIDGVPCTMFRISYVGENGWEVYTNMGTALRLWDTIAGPARSSNHPVGIGVYAVTERIEKGYRLMGAEPRAKLQPRRE